MGAGVAECSRVLCNYYHSISFVAVGAGIAECSRVLCNYYHSISFVAVRAGVAECSILLHKQSKDTTLKLKATLAIRGTF